MKEMINAITLAGTVSTEPTWYMSTKYGKKLYWFLISVKRLSGTVDILPCLVHERLVEQIEPDKKIKLNGRLATRNVQMGDRRCLDIYMYVKDIEEYGGADENHVVFESFLCKPPTYRKTPAGREISDLCLANNAENGFSCYMPSIAWHQNARFASRCYVGDEFFTTGRFQSRGYIKDGEEKIAHEYSIKSLILRKGEKLINESNDQVNAPCEF